MRAMTSILGDFRRLHRDQRGQTIFLGVFYVLILASLTFLIFNSGHKANTKVAMQNAADASAVTGAGWYARGLNTISMCNTTQCQLLSVILLLDTMETTAPVAQRIIDDLVSNIGRSDHGRDVPNNPLLADWLMVSNARAEQDMLRRLNQMISQIPMNEYCSYDDGVLWQCCYVLNELAGQMAEITPEMCQREATKVGDENGAEVAFLLPFYPELPIKPIDNSGASFRNFLRPMRDARTPDGRRIRGFHTIQGYDSRRNGRTLGPFSAMREPFVEPVPMGLFELSRFSVLFLMVSDKKIEMMFGNPDPRVALEPGDRIEDYDELVDYVNKNGASAVQKTYWTRISFNSHYEFGTDDFYRNVQERDRMYPHERLTVYNGYRPAPGGYTRSTEPETGTDPRHEIWYRNTERRTAHYPQIGIVSSHGPPWREDEYQPYYHTSIWRFDGADVALSTELHRRYLPPAGQPPHLAPILLANEGMKNDTNIYERFSMVAFAYRPTTSKFWPNIFSNPVPTENRLIGYAQAEIFNESCTSRSWDLFTQNWRARLVRMNHWDWSRDRVADGVDSDVAQRYVGSDDLEPVLKMLEMYDEDYVDLVTH